MAPTPATDRQILETLVETHRDLISALRSSDLRRDSSDRALRVAIEKYTAEVQSSVVILLDAEGKRQHAEAKAAAQPSTTNVTIDARSEESAGVDVSFGGGKGRSRIQIGKEHWDKISPKVLWFATTILTGIGLGKLFAAAAGAH